MQTTTVKNWAIGTTPDTLQQVHQNNVNIAIYQRDSSALVKEVKQLLDQKIELSS